MTTIYDFECVDLQGRPLPLGAFAGQPLLIVNTASHCGFAVQYKGIEETWRKHKDQGLVVLGMPSNDFGQQEPGDSAAIASLCAMKFGVTFPMLRKTAVSGVEAHPLFKFLGAQGGYLSKPRWNFYKYIVGRNGHLQDWFTSLTSPDSSRFTRAVEKAVIP